MLHLTNPCAKRKVLNRTKPKDKIYKTKSLGHYITTFYGVVAIEKGAFWSPSTTVANFTYLQLIDLMLTSKIKLIVSLKIPTV